MNSMDSTEHKHASQAEEPMTIPMNGSNRFTGDTVDFTLARKHPRVRKATGSKRSSS